MISIPQGCTWWHWLWSNLIMNKVMQLWSKTSALHCFHIVQQMCNLSAAEQIYPETFKIPVQYVMFLFMYVCWICRKYFVQLTAALQHMHSRRVMHRGILMWFHYFHLSFMINLERNWSMWNMKYVLSPTNHTCTLWLSRSHMHSPLTSPWNLAIYIYTYPVYPWNE